MTPSTKTFIICDAAAADVDVVAAVVVVAVVVVVVPDFLRIRLDPKNDETFFRNVLSGEYERDER